MFAAKGYDALTMRNIATACGMKAPSLYNHFADKKSLYEASLAFVFEQQGVELMVCLNQPISPEARLQGFIELACFQASQDEVFRQLFIRELIDQHPERTQFLVQVVLSQTCHALHDVFLAINADCDPHFLTTSLMGLLLFHFQINPLRPMLPGGSEAKQQLGYLSERIQMMIQLSLGFKS